MEDLRTNLVQLMHDLNKDWEEAIKKSEESGEIDLLGMTSKFSEKIVKLNKFFIEFQGRQKPKKKGFLG